MRHGRKSERRRFDGHKAHLAVDPESQLITAADVLAGNAPDHERALELVEQAEANAEFVVEEVVGDCAYGDGDTRRTFAGAGRKLVAKVATRRGGAQFPKEDFRIDLEVMSCVCPPAKRRRRWCRSVRATATQRRARPCGRFASTRSSATAARSGPRACERASGRVGWL
jgi:hypothetical protein